MPRGRSGLRQPPKKHAISGGGASGIGGLTDYTNAQDIKNRFWQGAATRRQKGDKSYGDADYWREGRCNWGGNHNLMEDCQTLATWANNVVSVESDSQELTLALNEQEFNLKKQQLVSKIQDCINKCQVSDAWSIGNICCIWNDYFGSFLMPFIGGLKQKLQSQMNDLAQIEPKHQREILELKAEIEGAEAKYNKAMANAAKETDPVKKAQFIAIAQQATKKIKELQVKLAKNPLSKLAEYSYLSDIGRLLGGNIPNNLPTVPSGGAGSPSPGGSGNDPDGGGGNPWTPWGGNSGETVGNQQNNQQLIIFAVAAAVFIFIFLNQKEERTSRRHYEEDYY